ncbi:MAG: acyl-CoA dehydrogenase family protein [Candidatus Binatia bacterium]
MIGFQPTEEQQLVVDTVAAFARERIRPCAHQADETGVVPADLVEQGWGLGLVQSVIPEAYGGSGDARSAIAGALVAEELAWGDLSIALHLLAPRLVAYPVVEMGTPEQRERILKTYSGPRFRPGSAALVEPRWDFDPSALGTTATRQNGAYVLNGSKCLVPLGAEAGDLLIYARIDGETGDHGVAGFLLDHGTPGLAIVERERNMGLKALATHTIVLDHCRVTATSRLGGEAAGSVMRLWNQSRVGLAAAAVGVARAAFEYARDYAKERRAFGVAIAQKQAIAFMLAEMAIEIDAARLLCWEAAWKLDRGEDATREAYLAKQYAANMVLTVTDHAVQILGGHGYIREHPVERWLRNGRGFAAFEGLMTV